MNLFRLSEHRLAYLSILILLVMATIVIWEVRQTPVKQITLYGDFYNIDLNQLKALAYKWEASHHYALDKADLEKQVEQLSWVDKVVVDFPQLGEVRIRIKEVSPLFRWHKNYIVTDKGDYFKAGPLTFLKYVNLPVLISSTETISWTNLIFKAVQKLPKSWRESIQHVAFHPWGMINVYFDNVGVTTDLAGLNRQFILLPEYFELLKQAYKKPIKMIDLRYNNSVAFD